MAGKAGVRFVMVMNRFPQLIAGVNRNAKIVEHKVHEKIAAEARARVRVKTGETRDSIKVTKDGVEAGGAAGFLEFGTVHMKAYPFLGPAVQAAHATIEVEFTGLFAGLGGSPLP